MLCPNCGFELAEHSNGVWKINGLTISNGKILCPKCKHDVTDLMTKAGVVKITKINDLKEYLIERGLTEEQAQKLVESLLRNGEGYTFKDFFKDWILPFILVLVILASIALLPRVIS